MLLANDLLDRMGLAAFGRLAEGATPSAAAEAALVARAALGLGEAWRSRAAPLPGAEDRYAIELGWRRMHEAAAGWFLRRATPMDGGIAGTVAAMAGTIAALRAAWPEAPGDALLDAALVMGESGAAAEAVAAAWREAGSGLGLDQLRAACAAVAAADPAAARALSLLSADLGAMQRRFATALLAGGGVEALKANAGAAWAEAERCVSALAAEAPSLAAILVATHALRAVA
jgi:NAD-specific glutamate dehydrogenase